MVQVQADFIVGSGIALNRGGNWIKYKWYYKPDSQETGCTDDGGSYLQKTTDRGIWWAREDVGTNSYENWIDCNISTDEFQYNTGRGNGTKQVIHRDTMASSLPVESATVNDVSPNGDGTVDVTVTVYGTQDYPAPVSVRSSTGELYDESVETIATSGTQRTYTVPEDDNYAIYVGDRQVNSQSIKDIVIDNQTPEGISIDGEAVKEVTIDGDVVWQVP